MRIVAAIMLLGLLAACGADGAPIRPVAAPAVAVEGQASLGVRL